MATKMPTTHPIVCQGGSALSIKMERSSYVRAVPKYPKGTKLFRGLVDQLDKSALSRSVHSFIPLKMESAI